MFTALEFCPSIQPFKPSSLRAIMQQLVHHSFHKSFHFIIHAFSYIDISHSTYIPLSKQVSYFHKSNKLFFQPFTYSSIHPSITSSFICEIWDFYGNEVSGWRWRQQDLPKHWYHTTSLHGVTGHKTATWILPFVQEINLCAE